MKAMWAMFIFMCLLFLYLAIVGQIKEVEGAEIRQWTGIVVHHSGGKTGNVLTIERDHKARGFKVIGYHFVIYKDGYVHPGRGLWRRGAHAKLYGKDRNGTHIGICLIGNNAFTSAQKSALIKLCKDLRKRYNIKSIERHHDICPGPNLAVEKLEKEAEI